jgi:IK cytokine
MIIFIVVYFVIRIGEDYAERRKMVIQESKYLGGDMEHTHLVKGLDYALLEKVF